MWPKFTPRCSPDVRAGRGWLFLLWIWSPQSTPSPLPPQRNDTSHGELWHCGYFAVYWMVTVSFKFTGIWSMTAVVVVVVVSKLAATRVGCSRLSGRLIVRRHSRRSDVILPVDGLPPYSAPNPPPCPLHSSPLVFFSSVPCPAFQPPPSHPLPCPSDSPDSPPPPPDPHTHTHTHTHHIQYSQQDTRLITLRHSEGWFHVSMTSDVTS